MDKIKRYVEDFLKTTKVKEEDQLYTNELDARKKGYGSVGRDEEGRRHSGMSIDDYKLKIIEAVNEIDDERFLNQIRTLLKLHVEKKGGAA